MFKRLKSSQGVTIIELLIALSILGLVVSVAFSMQSYGLASFSRGESLATRQQNVRMVARVLSEEVRFAEEIVVSDSVEESGYTYYWSSGGSILKGTETNHQAIVDSTKDTSYSLEYRVVKPELEVEERGASIVEFTIQSQSSQGPYALTSAVQGLNLSADDIKGLESGSVLGIKH